MRICHLLLCSDFPFLTLPGQRQTLHSVSWSEKLSQKLAEQQWRWQLCEQFEKSHTPSKRMYAQETCYTRQCVTICYMI